MSWLCYIKQTAMRKILSDLQAPLIEQELLALWLDYEAGGSTEAVIAMQLDKFEMIVQAFEYEQAQGILLDSFFSSTQDVFTHPEVLSWAEELRNRRKSWLLQREVPSK